jgi:SNF2 family DNA or RNA helicase
MTPHLFYIITTVTQPKISYFIQPVLAVPKKGKSQDIPQLISDLADIPEELLTLEDMDILKILSDIKIENAAINLFPLHGDEGVVLLENLIDTGRLHFASHRSPALKRGKKQYGKLSWVNEAAGKQRLHCWISGGANIVLPVSPLWYIDSFHHEAGELDAGVDPQTAAILLFAPSLPPEEIREIYALLKTAQNEKDIHQKLRDHLQKINAPITEKNMDTWYCDWKAVTAQKNWFDVEMGIEHEGQRINLLPLLAKLVHNQLSLHSMESLLKLPDDKIFTVAISHHQELQISMKRLKKILMLFTELYEEDILSGNEQLRLSALRALQLSQLKETLEIKHLKWQGDTTAAKLIEKFDAFKKNQSVPVTLPKEFCGELRLYQQNGVHWLQFLRNTGFGGILADDMGLGKTVQVLAHLLLEKNKKSSQLPTLIVTHTSLVMNWAREAKRFTPQLSVLVLQGHARKEYFNKFHQYDAVITTYPLLIRDEEILCRQEYHILILDEAQYIKNLYSRAGQVARNLSAVQRLCLTGTPIENHLGELWALFHFLLPGLLGDKKQFHRLFRLPIEKNQDSERLQSLRQRISPFFLRRIKQDVLTELPEKIEIVRPVLLTDIQRETYENIRISLHQEVLSAIQLQGVARSQIYILSALLKLRQVCCDPRLLKNHPEIFDESASAKLQLLLELLPPLILQGRRILLFSQFTEMLAFIEQALNTHHIKYIKLTGKTENRDEVIQTFQRGEVPLFLVSLKAGGVGLNLTRADTVIHYDPWWNPAVENQATDRAHRIGQDKTVFVYKLITSNTIEEKIMALQQEKKSLFDAILSGNQLTFEKFSAEDIENLFAPLT